MPSPRAVAAVIVALLFLLMLVGCGGGGGGPAAGPQQPAGLLDLEGRVVAADHPARVLPLASVVLLPSGLTTTTDGDGHFLFTNVPAGQITVQVTPTAQPGYAAAEVFVPLLPQNYLFLTVALLPRSAGAVTDLRIEPLSQEVEVGSQVQFRAEVVTDRGTTGLVPTWLAVGSAGTIDAAGVFVASAVGSSTIYAFSGDKYTSTTLSAVRERGPAVLETIVDPVQLPATGGQIVITAACTDPQEIAAVEALIFDFTGNFQRVGCALVAGSDTDGTYRATYNVPPNSNLPDAGGVQARQDYEVRIFARDRAGNQTLTPPIPFSVEGLESPPPPLS